MGSTVFAKKTKKNASAKSAEEKRTVIDFEEDLIQGEAAKPELFYLLERKQYNFKKLIRLRENFLPEMRRTAEDIQPSGS